VVASATTLDEILYPCHRRIVAVHEVLAVGFREEDDSSRWAIVSRVPPDVVVMRADPQDVFQIARQARLVIARLPNGDVRLIGEQGALDELDEGARLFVRSWRERPLEKPDRPGEGLSWDHPGFQPPDRPPG
jgi:hypothetical protein